MTFETPTARRMTLSRISLLAATLIWGTSFVILKNTLDSITTLHLMAYHFTTAGLVMLIIGPRNIRQFNRSYFIDGGIMGVFLFAAYTSQTFGLVFTTPGINAFLTAIYCVVVPFMMWVIYKKRPDKYNIISAVICFCGVGFISIRSDFSIGLGELLTILCGFFFAAHMLATARFAEGRNIVLLNAVQLLAVAALSWISAFTFETESASFSSNALLGIIYLALMYTAVCYFLQTYGQKYTPPSSVAVIMTLEAVFGALFSVAFYSENLDFRLIFGFFLIFAATIISETKPKFLQRKTSVQ